ncbi:aldo/keto reductase [Cryobacterium adonitolivorans]|uniref:Aldo/keto reductase n=1 Tax=Cryobacterium adonitolivorans TaxID=1259189 RepID=A0A4R8WAB2_9MICO|nr:aldo/keto reductase [Cryobacterium adonitolivorans]
MVSLDPRPTGPQALLFSPLALGTSGWSPRSAAENSATDALAADFAAGRLSTNVIDSSNIYGDSHSEEVIGRALGGNDPCGSRLTAWAWIPSTSCFCTTPRTSASRASCSRAVPWMRSWRCGIVVWPVASVSPADRSR